MIKILLIILILLVIDRTIDRFSNVHSKDVKYIMTDEEIYYPMVDNGRELEYSRFNYKTKEVGHKYAKKIMNQVTSNHPKILVLGVALGGIIINILDKYPNSKVTGIDITDEYFDLVRKYSDTSRLTLVKEDAQKYIANNVGKTAFDIIICDISNGLSIPLFTVSKPFLDKINKMILPNGKFIINTINNDDKFIQTNLRSAFNKKPIIRNNLGDNNVYIVNF
jgi:spermidine synthase